VNRLDEDTANTVADIYETFNPKHRRRIPFKTVSLEGIDAEDRDFVCRIMRLGSEERPEAEKLLQDSW